MTEREQLAELRGLHARAANAVQCTPLGHVEKLRLRQLVAHSLEHAIDAAERLLRYDDRRAALPEIKPLTIPLAELKHLEPLTKGLK